MCFCCDVHKSSGSDEKYKRTKGVTIYCGLEGGNVPNIRVSEWVYMFCNGEQNFWAFLHHTSSSVSNTRVFTWVELQLEDRFHHLSRVKKYWKMTIIMFQRSRWCLQISCFVWQSAQNLFSLRSIIYDKHINLTFETVLKNDWMWLWDLFVWKRTGSMKIIFGNV